MNREDYISLERRMVAFSVAVIKLLPMIPQQSGTEEIKERMVRAATLAGAEYREAVRTGDLLRHVRKLESTAKGLSECSYWINLLHELHPNAMAIECTLSEACDLTSELDRACHESMLRLLRHERVCR